MLIKFLEMGNQMVLIQELEKKKVLKVGENLDWIK